MLLYEYRCEACGNQFTQRRPMDQRDDPLACPSCSSEQVKRLLPMPAMFSVGGGSDVRSLSASSCSGCSQTSCGSCGVSRPR